MAAGKVCYLFVDVGGAEIVGCMDFPAGSPYRNTQSFDCRLS